jgi:AbrB family looped-hinge helix DNA binding protein
MYTQSLHISSKGQITIPSYIRKLLQTDVIKISVDKENKISLEPVKDQAGSLHKFAILSEDLAVTRQKAWDESVKNRY